MTPKNITAKSKDTGVRLDVFLSEKLKISRSQIQKMIAAKQITINGSQPQKMGQALKTDDKITVAKNPATAKNKRAEFTIKDIKIIAQTPQYLIVEKPAGMLTHSTTRNEPDSLAYLLAKQYPELNKVGDNVKLRPGIVHRLDKDASGLLVVARTQAMFENLKNQFQKRTINKEYLALVHGQMARNSGHLDFRVGRADTGGKMAARPITEKGLLSEEGKDAATDFEVDQAFVNFTLVRVKIKTGRMHQIRAHFLAYNHPLCGDPLYSQRKRPDTWDKKLGRLFLHCNKLGFVDLEGESKEFSSAMPKTLTDFMAELKPPRTVK